MTHKGHRAGCATNRQDRFWTSTLRRAESGPRSRRSATDHPPCLEQEGGVRGGTMGSPTRLDLAQLAPFRVDLLDVVVGGVDRLLRGHLLLRDLREHLR